MRRGPGSTTAHSTVTIFIPLNNHLTYVRTSDYSPKNWLHSSGKSFDGSTSISNHFDIYIPVPRALWPWRWSLDHWSRPLKSCIAFMTTRIVGKIYSLVIWNLPNRRMFFFPFCITISQFWHIPQRKAHRRDIPQFLGTSINADRQRFIVLSGGMSTLDLRNISTYMLSDISAGGLSFSDLFFRSSVDSRMRKFTCVCSQLPINVLAILS